MATLLQLVGALVLVIGLGLLAVWLGVAAGGVTLLVVGTLIEWEDGRGAGESDQQ